MANNSLIDVQFIDRTNYVTPAPTDDIVGVVVETAWGLSDDFRIYDQVGWKAFSNPIRNSARVNQSFATVQRLFDAGNRYVEVYRPSGSETYMYFSGVLTSDVPPVPSSDTVALESPESSATITFDKEVTDLLAVGTVDWLTITGSGTSYTASVTENTGTSVRSATLVASDSAGRTSNMTLYQLPAALPEDPDAPVPSSDLLNIESTPSTNAISFNEEIATLVLANPAPWVTITGSGTDWSIAVLDNAMGSARSVTLIATDADSKAAQINVVQQAVDTSTDSTSAITSTAIAQTSSDYFDTIFQNEKAVYGIRFRYRGGFPGKMTITPYVPNRIPSGFDPSVNKLFQIDLYLEGEQSATETFVVSFQRLNLSGEEYFYADVLNNNSNYLVADLNYEITEDNLASLLLVDTTSTVEWEIEEPEALTASDYIECYSYFKDRSRSSSTILVSTFDPNHVDAQSVYGAVANAAELATDRVAFVGCAKSCFDGIDNVDKIGAIASYIDGIPFGDKFTGAIAAVESYVVSNRRFWLDGTASWAAATASVATSLQNRNQLASFLSYGATGAVLATYLDEDSVIKLMNTYGIGSIYKTNRGNLIFNIRSLYPVSTSYFSKLNVSRITSSVLRWLIADAERGIHTDITSDSAKRLNFQESENSKLGTMISRGELKAESYIDVSDAINTDVLTQGGECLNIDAYLYFKKLTERVKISIIASDQTTTQVTISQESI